MRASHTLYRLEPRLRGDENLQTLGLDGRERFTIKGIDAIKPGRQVQAEAVADDGKCG